MIEIDRLLESLNEQQREAVLYNEGDSLILAGAGSGKTRVLTTKIAYLLTQGYAPYEILALTFTNKAAREMRARIATMIGDGLASYLTMGTFHSVFAQKLRLFASQIGYTQDYSIYDTSDSKALIKMILKERNLDEKVYAPKIIGGLISSAKNNGTTPAMLRNDREFRDYLLSRRIPDFVSIYDEYQTRCRRANAMDFDDLLLNMYLLLKSNEEVRTQMQKRYRYILVDEYQDTNVVQHAVVQLLKGNDTLVCVVGDDAQSIYSFRGAVIDNILHFSKGFGGARVLTLTKNYRSTGAIVALADSLIAHNTMRIPKVIEAVAGRGDNVALIGAFTAQIEAQTVAARIMELITRRQDPEEIAILYRTNAQSRLFEDNLRMFGIPYRIWGGLSFFDRKEIKDLLAYLRLVLNPHDDEAFRRAHNTPPRGIGATTLTRLGEATRSHQVSYLEALQRPDILAGVGIKGAALASLHSFMELIDELRNLHDTLPPDAYLNQVILRSGMPSLYSDRSPESQAKLENIAELQNALSEYLHSREEEGLPAGSIDDFVREVALYTDRDTQDEDDDKRPKVTLMTMHASKGLEYQHVFVVGLEEGLIPSSMSSGSTASIEEERRLLYVAITRAKEHCTLTFARERMIRGEITPAQPSRFIRELESGYVDDFDGILTHGKGRVVKPSISRTSSGDELPHKTRYIRRKSDTSNTLAPGSPASVRTSSSIADGSLMDEIPGIPYAKGEYVYHHIFGRGLVLGFSDSISGVRIHVDFDGAQKVLIVKFAKLRKE